MTSNDHKQTIITHDGLFHTDEVTSYAMLDYIFPQNILIRTRDMSRITENSIVIDVGGVYDQREKRFDHHQKSFEETFDKTSDIVLSSTGLIYKCYGMNILEKFCREKKLDVSEKLLSEGYNHIYYNFLIEVDAKDNGIRQYSDNFYEYIESGKITQNYRTVAIRDIIASQNCVNVSDDKEQIKAFKRASDLAWTILSGYIYYYFSSQLKNVDDCKIFNRAMKGRFKYDKDGRIVVVKVDCNSWKKCLKEYEKKHPTDTKLLFMIYPNTSDTWNIRTISDSVVKTRKNLLPLDDIKKYLSHPDEVIFVHTKLFIGGAKTIETCVEMGIASMGLNTK